jgi:hypothetical protein
MTMSIGGSGYVSYNVIASLDPLLMLPVQRAINTYVQKYLDGETSFNRQDPEALEKLREEVSVSI